MRLPGRTGRSRQHDGPVSLPGCQFDNVVAGAQGRFDRAAQSDAQGHVAQRADRCEHRAQHPQWHVIALIVDELLGAFGRRREAARAAFY